MLEAFDALVWLRSAAQVAERYGLSEATTSRHRKRCLELCDLRMERRQGEWELIGDTSLLRLERQVHQQARWRSMRPLRLEVPYWVAPLLSHPALDGWVLGGANMVGVQRPFQLLDDRVLDALITGLPDLPAADHPSLMAIPLITMPAWFVVVEGHPLLRRQRLSYADLAEFPSLGLPAGSYPLVEQALRSLGLWNDGVRMHRYCRELWEGRAEQELLVGYGTSLSLEVSGQSLQRLPLPLPFGSGDALVLRRDVEHQPQLMALLQELHRRYAPKVQRYADVNFAPELLQRLGA